MKSQKAKKIEATPVSTPHHRIQDLQIELENLECYLEEDSTPTEFEREIRSRIDSIQRRANQLQNEILQGLQEESKVEYRRMYGRILAGYRTGNYNPPKWSSDLDDLIDECFRCAVEKGWWTDSEGKLVIHSKSIPEKIALQHSELSEALEEFRKGKHDLQDIYFHPDENDIEKPEGFVVELADEIIRIGDIAGAFKLPLKKALALKMAYNRCREYRHGGKKA